MRREKNERFARWAQENGYRLSVERIGHSIEQTGYVVEVGEVLTIEDGTDMKWIEWDSIRWIGLDLHDE